LGERKRCTCRRQHLPTLSRVAGHKYVIIGQKEAAGLVNLQAMAKHP
jgi:hypothetical protein